jgi:hypothetical protein
MYSKRGWDTKRWRRWFIVDRRAANVWFGALLLFAAIDLALLGYSVYALTFDDPGWLGEPPK